MEPRDFYEMSNVDLLEHCGADGRKWAEAFCQIKACQGWSSDDIDIGLMTTWFANAIEHSSGLRLSAQQREPVVRRLDWIERVGVAGTFDASTSIGHYIATITDDNRGMWFIVGQTTGEYMPPDIDAVQAAAQADYERRIMAAIEIAPQSDRRPSPSQKQVSETGKELPKNTEQPMNNADVSVGELAGFFVTEFPHLLTMSTQIEVARTLLASYRIERLDRLASGRR